MSKLKTKSACLCQDAETVNEIIARRFAFGFVEFDNAKNAFIVKESKDFDPIEVEEHETFEQAINATDLVEMMQSEWFDEVAPCHWIDDTMLENGKIHLEGGKRHWRDSELIDFDTEDIRDRVELPSGVLSHEVRFVIFTNGDDEDDVLEWGVFYPLSE